ncbi:MAG: site-specific integrase [Planctomycetota bacterium]
MQAISDGYRAYIKPLVSASHFDNIDRTLKLLCTRYGSTSANQFGPRRLKEVRAAMIGQGWKRGSINAAIRQIVAAFRWATSEELVSAEVHASLAAIPNLKSGEAGVEDGGRVLPVAISRINAVRPHLPRQVVAMIDLQLLTGMRPGEVVTMRLRELERVGTVWVYRPATHKNAHRGIEREVLLGPRAISILSPYLKSLKLDGYLFDPRQATAEYRAEGATTRRRRGQAETPRATDRTIGDHYTAGTYRQAIQRACKQAGVPRWSPNQLRHNAATKLRREHGLEKAALLLGHSEATVTATHYAERDRGALEAIVAKIG